MIAAKSKNRARHYKPKAMQILELARKAAEVPGYDYVMCRAGYEEVLAAVTAGKCPGCYLELRQDKTCPDCEGSPHTERANQAALAYRSGPPPQHAPVVHTAPPAPATSHPPPRGVQALF